MMIPWSEVQQEARALLRKYYEQMEKTLGRRPEAGEFFPVRVKEIVSQVLQWQIVEVPFIHADLVSGLMDFQERIIKISTTDSEQRQRFTLAHEVGHIVLHKRGPDVCLFRGDIRSVRYLTGHNPDRKMETEANQFAAELLMPTKAVRHEFKARFDGERIWSGSSLVRKAQTNMTEPYRISNERINSAEAAAKILAKHTSDVFPKPLFEVFDVSSTALEKRLVALGLVY